MIFLNANLCSIYNVFVIFYNVSNEQFSDTLNNTRIFMNKIIITVFPIIQHSTSNLHRFIVALLLLFINYAYKPLLGVTSE